MIKNQIETDILIIGGGLSGLYISYLLRQSKYRVQLVDARSRLGGRIHTLYNNNDANLEMGATWLGHQHKNLKQLLNTLGINTFDQVIGSTAIYEAISTSPHYLAKLPPNPEPSMRIQGGSSSLIKALEVHCKNTTISLNQPITSIKQKDNTYCSESGSCTYISKMVISTLPPKLFVSKIEVSPKLPSSLTQIAHQTHTWMGESIKIGLTYKTAFWRADHLSGTIMSNVGPIPEMYDHSNYADNKFALKGFLNGNYFSISKEERIEMILLQLEKYYGPIARTYSKYEETIWRKEEHTFQAYDSHVLPHQNNGHAVFQDSYLGGGLLLSGTETSPQYPGYMEGAIVSAKQAVERINTFLTKNELWAG